GRLHDVAHDAALGRPGRGHRTFQQVGLWYPVVDLGQGQAGAGDQAEHAGEGRDAVHGRAELRDDEAAPAVAGEDAVVRGGRLGEDVLGRGRPVDLDAVEAADLLGDARRGDRQRHAPAPALGGDQVEHDEQAAVVADQLAVLVDERDALADRVEPYAERRPR